MAVVIALCISAFVVAYAQLDPFTRDFIAQSTPTPTPAPSGSGNTADTNSNDNNSSASSDSSNDNSSNPDPTNTPAPTPTPDAFVADYLSNTEQAVNFRSGPGTDNDVIQLIDASTPLKSTGEEQDDGDGTAWMEFELEDGTIGWIRQIDAVSNN
ncbi:MAG: SH3 domain-containing protein [Thermomicrobiales bacterium]